MCRCWRACSIDDVVAMTRLVISSFCLRALFPVGPADVPLPTDPLWKRDYAASVRRLVRDGVDRPLATLFVHAARTVSLDAEGTDRARSATAAFLYHRLQTLPETRGASVSTPRCRSRSMGSDNSRLISCARGARRSGIGRRAASRRRDRIPTGPKERSSRSPPSRVRWPNRYSPLARFLLAFKAGE
jgi:hypothetical protein